MNPRALDRRVVWASVGLVLALVVWLLVTAAVLWSTLDAGQRDLLRPLLSDRGDSVSVLVVMMLLVFAGLGIYAFQALARHFLAPAAQLAEEATTLARTDVVRPLIARSGAENQALAHVLNLLVEQRGRLRLEMDQRVREASQRVELEKSRLAALMSELTQSVVVCNLDGRILLYNQRARLQFRALSPAPSVSGGVELMGLGRSIYSVFDRKLVTHALESIQQRMLRGAAHPSAQFVTTTAAGQLLRVQMAPVRAAASSEDPYASAENGPGSTSDARELTGFVLMLENITLDYESDAARDQVLHTLTEGSRSALASIQAAMDMLDYPDLDTPTRERFLRVIREEVLGLSARIATVESGASAQIRNRWPLEDMLGADLVSAAVRRIETVTGLPVAATEIDPTLWLKVESFSLLQALVYLSGRLADEFEARFVQIRLGAAPGSPGKGHLDLIWSGGAMSTETVMSWEMDPMRVGQDSTRLSVRDVVERHSGAFWFERERVRHQAFFRFLLPLARPQEQIDTATFVRNEARPEYYDFDLFRTTDQTRSLDERKLADLAYTVFDTETTGLDPGGGDEIIQIGAARIVNGKLLRHESFEQLVDPRRSLPAASIPIHGITPDMLKGQPGIETVLPAFHLFAQDTVLVAHNAAFDMRFLQLKERKTGVVFDQPVLDTLLLSALVHPQQSSHRLEAIAERFNVPVIGRHTAI
ncbi:MAG: exonuclease domain-containing protein, partial [Hydrogenophaga sp.]